MFFCCEQKVKISNNSIGYIFKVFDKLCLQTVQSQVEGYINLNFSNKMRDYPQRIINLMTLIRKFRIFQEKCLGSQHTIALVKKEIVFQFSKRSDNVYTMEPSIAYFSFIRILFVLFLCPQNSLVNDHERHYEYV